MLGTCGRTAMRCLSRRATCSAVRGSQTGRYGGRFQSSAKKRTDRSFSDTTSKDTKIVENEGAAASTPKESSEISPAPPSSNDMVWYAGMIVPTALIVWGLADDQSPPAKFAESIGLLDMMEFYAGDIIKPAHDKLLPDWSQMPNVPHDIPVPHTLVLDLESTLVSTTWDRKHGWRHAKRPGVDKFLMDMAQYFEIVLYSPSIDGIADPVVTALDQHGCIMHRLYRDSTYYQKGVHVKDLKRLNRNINRIIVLDDDPAEVQFNPDNLIRVKPYTDPSDREDNTLERITPFLIDIARQGHNDIPGLLRQYQGMDADQIADEQERRLSVYQQRSASRASRGLSGIAKMARRTVDMTPELEPKKDTFAPVQITAKDVVGAAPPQKQTGLVGFLSRRQEEKAENDRRKYEKWQQTMMKKQQEQAQKQQ